VVRNLPEGVTNVGQFDSTVVLQACGLCFKILDLGVDLPSKLPSSIGDKYAVCTVIANNVQVDKFDRYNTFADSW